MRILYRNAIDVSEYTITTNDEESGYPATNLQDPTLAAKWRSLAFTNLIDRPDCESTTPPALTPETSITIGGGPDATAVRDATEAHAGTYSYLMTKTVAAGTAVEVSFQDDVVTTNMHGLTAGNTYTWEKWIKIPSIGGIAVNEMILRFADYVSAAWVNTDSGFPKILDAWQKISITKTLSPNATGIKIQLIIVSTASSGEIFYIDDLALYDTPQIKIDAGANNVISAKSFAIGGHNLTGEATITIQGNDTSDFDSPNYNDELARNLILNSEDLTTSDWSSPLADSDLTNLYLQNKRLTKGIATSNGNAALVQVQYPNNTIQSFQAIVRVGETTDTILNYQLNASPFTTYGIITITWATKSVVAGGGLTNLDYDWIDDETVWVAGTANSIDTSLVCRLSIYICPTDQTTGKYIYATAVMVEDNSTVTHYDEIQADPRVYFYSEQSFRYWQILIEDFDNPDDYVEVGRPHHGDYLGLGDIIYREFPIELASTSDKRYTVTGQLYGDQGIIQRLYNFQFPHLTDDQRQMIENMFFYSDIILPVFLIINENDFSKLKPLYASINDDLNHNHIFNFLYNNTLSFKEAK